MVKKFSKTENQLLMLFTINKTFSFCNSLYKIEMSGKPRSVKGEPKTDVYVRARCLKTSEILELKISYKQKNADFLENKISAERAEEIFGDQWRSVIKSSALKIQQKFDRKKLIFKDKYRNTQKGSITLGWRCEIVNKGTGELVDKLELTMDQLVDIYSGTNLPIEKKNSLVGEKMVPESGVANYMLIGDVEDWSLQDTVDNLIPVQEYVKNSPDLYFTFKALNYRSFAKKIEGNRPLAVQVIWKVRDNKMESELNFYDPLEIKGNYVRDVLKEVMNILNIENTDAIDSTVAKSKVIYELS